MWSKRAAHHLQNTGSLPTNIVFTSTSPFEFGNERSLRIIRNAEGHAYLLRHPALKDPLCTKLFKPRAYELFHVSGDYGIVAGKHKYLEAAATAIAGILHLTLAPNMLNFNPNGAKLFFGGGAAQVF